MYFNVKFTCLIQCVLLALLNLTYVCLSGGLDRQFLVFRSPLVELSITM